ncbi:MAG: AAA family ATPase [Ancalomicrobiaceae bacterium]|nr:AAA family ATPase [Ancalomicrobiaceae bacterium]
MFITGIRIASYKSFEDTGEISLQRGTNLFVGHNNSGKSALLNAIKIIPQNVPHIDGIHTLPGDRANTSVYIDISLTFDDIISHAKRFLLPIVRLFYSDNITSPDGSLISLSQQQVYELYRESKDIRVCIDCNAQPKRLRADVRVGDYLLHLDSITKNQIVLSKEGTDYVISSVPLGSYSETVGLFYDIFNLSTFYFQPERLNIGVCPAQYVTSLDSDARNLPAFLDTLNSTRRDYFEKLVRHMREVIPTVGNISTRAYPPNPVAREVLVWPTQTMNNAEFAFPLTSCGTGVAQALAILSVISTSPASTILVDEMNNFLHPASIKALLRIMQMNYGYHQYIISGHSPDVIASSNPNTIHLIQKAEYISSISNLVVADFLSYSTLAAHLGVSISDALVANCIVWVEGPTEQVCLPYLAAAFGVELPNGVAFIPVINTGDLTGKSKRQAIDIAIQLYERMVKYSLASEKATAFGFDSEGLSTTVKEDLARRSKGRILFLPRRNIECYMLDAQAIADYISGIDFSRKVNFTKIDVVNAYTQHCSQYGAGLEFDALAEATEPHSNGQIDGAAIVSTIVRKLTDARFEYNKRTDGVKILSLRTKFTAAERIELTGYIGELIKLVQPQRIDELKGQPPAH